MLENNVENKRRGVIANIHVKERGIDISVGFIVVILNFIEIILILRLKHKKTFEYVLLSLCVADLLFGLSNSIVSIIWLTEFNTMEVLNVNYTTYFFFVITSIFYLLFIALDTLYAIVQPILHNVFMTKKRARIIIIAIWLVAISIALGIYLANKN